VGSMKKGQKLIDAEKKFSLWLVVAAVSHALLLFIAMYLQILDAGKHAKPKLLSVSLVSLPGTGGSNELAEKQGGTKAISTPSNATSHPPVNKKIVKVKAPIPVPEKALVQKKNIVIEPLKPKVVEKPADISKALERIKLNVDKKTTPSQPSTASNLNDALAQLQKKVKSQGEATGAGNGGGRGSSTTGRTGTGKGYGGGGPSAPYKAGIASIIMQNWEFSKLLLKNSYGMQVYVRINILANGTISQIVFDKRAPSEYLNNSVKKALEKSSPLPVLPKEEGASDIWIGFVFTPEGIEK
jgi:colicin import membrane protein